MRNRHEARELALKALFAFDIGKSDPDCMLEHLSAEEGPRDAVLKYSKQLIEGVANNKATIDSLIDSNAIEWKLNRMAAVDRNIMRVALYEILFAPDVPQAVAVNEAIEIAKVYGANDSPRFINGILGNIIKNTDEV